MTDDGGHVSHDGDRRRHPTAACRDDRSPAATFGRLADVNLAATWSGLGRLAGCPTAQVGDLSLFATGLPMAFFNGAIAGAPTSDPDHAIDRCVAFMAEQDVPWLLWVREGVDDALLEAGRTAGLRDAGGPPAMCWSPITPPSSVPPRLDIIVAADEADLAVHRDLMTRAFGAPPEVATRIITTAMLDDPTTAIVIGRVDGEPVSTALVSVTGSTAGVYNVATPPEHQRHGYGRALTHAAVDEGARRGCDHAVLQSSPAGQPVYESMGFVHIGRYVQLEGPPT